MPSASMAPTPCARTRSLTVLCECFWTGRPLTAPSMPKPTPLPTPRPRRPRMPRPTLLLTSMHPAMRKRVAESMPSRRALWLLMPLGEWTPRVVGRAPSQVSPSARFTKRARALLGCGILPPTRRHPSLVDECDDKRSADDGLAGVEILLHATNREALIGPMDARQTAADHVA